MADFNVNETKEYEDRMQKSIEYLQDELNNIRAGRANPRVLDQISVDYYGVSTPLNQVASITVPEPRQLLIQPWDKTLLDEIEKAILNSDLSLNPNNDGSALRLHFPTLTEERRRDLTKQVDKLGEETKISIRNIRREYLDKAKKAEKSSDISEDELRLAEENIQKLTDKYTEKVDEKVKSKSEELMEI